jgi:hypothetical protein
VESRIASSRLVRRPECKLQLGRPRLGSEDNIKIDLKEIWYDVESVLVTTLKSGGLLMIR